MRGMDGKSTETSIAKNIRIADDKANYDAACKRLLSEKVILAWVMRGCLEEYRDCTVDEIAQKYIEGRPQVGEVPVAPDETNMAPRIHGIGSEDASITEGTVTYDIRFTATAPGSGERIRLIINIEAQNDFYPGYPLIKRGLYYCSRMISSQYGTEFTGSHYGGIKKVYSIWICMDPPGKWENSITRYAITEENLVGDMKEKKSNYDLMAAIMVCLGRPGGRDPAGVLGLLDVLLSTGASPEEKCQILEEDFQIEMTQALESEVSLMCNLSKGVEEKGIKKGIEQGIELGKIHGAISTYQEVGLAEDAISKKLQERFHLSEEEVKEYLQAVK